LGAKVFENGLTTAQERFCIEAIKPNATNSGAYRIAFPKSNKWKNTTVAEEASRLTKHPAVAAKLKELRERINELGIVSVEEAMKILSMMSRADIRKCYDDNNKLKNIQDIDDQTAIALVEVSTKDGKAKLANRKDAVETILKWHGAKAAMGRAEDAGDTALIEGPANAYDLARRIAWALGQAPKKQITGGTTT
tara:strand:- start:7420 stop:8001 length:582 start_codon:yes stop_codon:yes gene_type:complete